MLTVLQTFALQFYEIRCFPGNISKFAKLLFWYKNYKLVAASEFMYDNYRVNIGDEHGDKILEYDIEKTICMFFLMLYLNLLRMYATSKISFHNA